MRDRCRCRRAALGAAALALAAAALLLAGCTRRQPPESGPTPPPAAGFPLTVEDAQGVAVRTQRQPPESGPTPPPAAGFPLTVEDAQGVAVRIERAPRRIVSLAPTVTEILFALGVGDRVVAAADPADYPPEAEKLPRVGGWFTPSTERTLGADPDLVIGSRGNPPDVVAILRKSGCPVFTTDPKTLEGIFASIEDLGLITAAQAAAAELIADLRARLAEIAAGVGEVPEEKMPTAFIVIGLNPVWTAGPQTFQHDAIRAAGARNIAEDRQGFHPFSTESLLAADPDYLLLSTMEGDPDRMKRDLLADPVLRRLSAAREGRLLVLEANHIMRPGPRIVEAVEAMARAFYPDRFGPAPGPSSSSTSNR